MGSIRFLSCGESVENYNICLDEKVAGFVRNTAKTGDLVYFSFKVMQSDKKFKSYCGARGTLGELTDKSPWDDGKRYAQVFKVINLELCTPFEITFLRDYNKSWGLVFIIGSKAIDQQKYKDLANRLDLYFSQAKTEVEILNTNNTDNEFDVNDEMQEVLDEETLEESVEIMGTFQTINFISETHKTKGLEALVTKHFYNLFKVYNQEKSMLIPENRLFSTSGVKNSNSKNITGIKGIPDAILLCFDFDNKNLPIQINLIEYECYGEQRTSSSQKFNYMNDTIIPQLIKFASGLSIVADNTIRQNTISSWIEKIINYIDDDNILMEKTSGWIRALYPSSKTKQINSLLERELKKAFESNIQIILIIDELTMEQEKTIEQVIQSFKLDNVNSKTKDNCIKFKAYTVRLEQKIDSFDDKANYALSFK